MRSVFWGASAGGQLAALAGLLGHHERLPGEGDVSGDVSVRAVADAYGPSNMTTAGPTPERTSMPGLESWAERFLGGKPNARPDIARAASPVLHVRHDAPPFQIYHRLADDLVSWRHSWNLHTALVARGAESELFLLEGYRHGFVNAVRRGDLELEELLDGGRLQPKAPLPRGDTEALQTMGSLLASGLTTSPDTSPGTSSPIRCLVQTFSATTSTERTAYVKINNNEPAIHPSAWVAPGAIVAGAVAVAAEASVWYTSVLRADNDTITVGAGSNIQDDTIVHADPGFPATVGEEVSVGHRAVLHGCTIEDDCLIGMGAIVLNGAVIGRGSLIAAGAVVLEGTEIPPGSLVAGIPGKIRRQLTEHEQAATRRNAANYRVLHPTHRAADS